MSRLNSYFWLSRQKYPLSHFWISAACSENINFALPPLLEFGLTKYDFSTKSHFFVFFQPKFQEEVSYFSSYLRHGGMTIEFSSSGHPGILRSGRRVLFLQSWKSSSCSCCCQNCVKLMSLTNDSFIPSVSLRLGHICVSSLRRRVYFLIWTGAAIPSLSRTKADSIEIVGYIADRCNIE